MTSHDGTKYIYFGCDNKQQGSYHKGFESSEITSMTGRNLVQKVKSSFTDEKFAMKTIEIGNSLTKEEELANRRFEFTVL